jgi:uncharacterized membrane protein
MKLRVVPSAPSLILSGGIPGLIAVTPAPAAAAKSAYTMTDLGNLGGGVSLGFGINASREVVGRSYLDKVFFFKCGKHTCRFTQNDPFSWTAGMMTDLGTFSATAMSEATAVNRGGDVVGGSGGHALLVHNGTMSDLGLGEATGINDVGQIVGNSQGAFVINDNGQIVASGSNAQGQEHAFLLTQLVSAPRIYRPPA